MEADLDRKFTEIHIPVPWGTIAGRWYGDHSLRPILLIHGLRENCGTFARLAPLLVSHASLLCIDLPGHGYSTHLPAGMLYYLMVNVRIILHLLDSYNWQKVSIIGHSIGAGIAFEFAAIHPKRVDMLIAIDLIKRRYFDHDEYIRELNYCFDTAVPENYRLMTQINSIEPPSYTFKEWEKRIYNFAQSSLELENCKHIVDRNIAKSKQYPNRYFLTSDNRVKLMFNSNPSIQFQEQMAVRICNQSIPYMVIKGGASDHIDKRSIIIDIMNKHNPHFEMHEIAGGTHHLHLNTPEAVAEIIKKFLQKHRPLEKIKLENQLSLSDKAKL